MIWLLLYLVIGIIAAVHCYYLGFYLTIVEIVGMLVATAAALVITRPASLVASRWAHGAAGLWAAVALIACWVAIQALWFRLLKGLLMRVPRAWQVSPLNKLSGALLGGAWATAFTIALLFVSLSLPLGHRLKAAIRIAPIVSSLVARLGQRQEQLSQAISHNLLEPLGVISLQSHRDDQVIPLNFKTTQATPSPQLEQQMLAMVNSERKAAGLRPLEADSGLATVARAHSSDMLAKGYFAHLDPAGHDPFWRIHAGGVDYLAAGENLALAPSLDLAHTGLMNSPEHRANILSSDYGRVGIGVLDAGQYGLMVTQDFVD